MVSGHATQARRMDAASGAAPTKQSRTATAILTVAMLVGALLWLILLVTTNFSPLPLCAGLLAMVYVMGLSADQHR